jgi:hypothetical protein
MFLSIWAVGNVSMAGPLTDDYDYPWKKFPSQLGIAKCDTQFLVIISSEFKVSQIVMPWLVSKVPIWNLRDSGLGGYPL